MRALILVMLYLLSPLSSANSFIVKDLVNGKKGSVEYNEVRTYLSGMQNLISATYSHKNSFISGRYNFCVSKDNIAVVQGRKKNFLIYVIEEAWKQKQAKGDYGYRNAALEYAVINALENIYPCDGISEFANPSSIRLTIHDKVMNDIYSELKR